MPALTVIGVGNRLRGDDGLGAVLIDALSQLSLANIELVDAGSDALGILEYLAGRERVLIVDACRLGQEPGALQEFQPSEIDMVLNHDPISLHGLGLAEAIRMAESLHMLPADLKIIGIEPDSIQFNAEISVPVQRALKLAIEIIHDKLKQVSQVAHA